MKNNKSYQAEIYRLKCCIKALEEQINNGGGADTDWIQVAGAAVYNITENIGIGTALPDRKLDLVGDARMAYENTGVTGTYEIEFGEIDLDNIAPGFNSEGYRIAVIDGLTGNGVEEIMMADDSALGVEGYWRKHIETTNDSGDKHNYTLLAEPDGLTISATQPTTSNASQVRFTPDGGLILTSETNGGSDTLSLTLNENGVVVSLTSGTKVFRIEGLPEYVDNTAASAVLNIGDWYETPTGEIRVVK